MKLFDKTIPGITSSIVMRCCALMMATLLSTGTFAATAIKAKYDATTQGKFVITSNDGNTSSKLLSGADLQGKAVVAYGSSAKFVYAAGFDNKSTLVVKATRGAFRLLRENGSADETPLVHFRLSALGGTYTGSRDNREARLFLPDGACFASQQSTAQTNGRIRFDTRGSYTINCRVADTDQTAIKIEDMIGVFELEFPDPLKMPSGIYNGIIKAPPSMNGAVALQDIEVQLTVEHSIKVDFPKTSVDLKPNARGSGHDGPGAYRGSVDFSVTSVDPFTIYLACSDQVSDQCSISHNSLRTKRYLIEVKVALPGMTNGGGAAKLSTTKQGSPIVKLPQGDARQAGHLQFDLTDSMTRNMPAGTYSGKVTVIFDAVLD